ncbi:hypothetical protein ACO1O0_003755 [Amphichorda felina]
MSLVPAIATVSLGRASAGHSLFKKVEQAAAHSFKGVEVFYECLEHHASTLPGGLSNTNILLAAQQTRILCDQHGIAVICLQPFGFFEGLESKHARAAALEKLQFWFRLAHALRTDLIQIPSNFLQQGASGDLDMITADLAEAARLGMNESPVIRLAYEGVSWGTHINTWEGTWEVVKKVNMPNLGLCLDTFHIAARVWGDPTAESGRRQTGDADLAATLKTMAENLDVGKIFYIQVGDAERLASPLIRGHQFYREEQPDRMSWSRNARLFAFEHNRGAYLPIEPILDVIIRQLKYKGWG